MFPEGVEEALKFPKILWIVWLLGSKTRSGTSYTCRSTSKKTNGEEELKAFAREHLAAYKIPKNPIQG